MDVTAVEFSGKEIARAVFGEFLEPIGLQP
jgi:hypothetical protein